MGRPVLPALAAWVVMPLTGCIPARHGDPLELSPSNPPVFIETMPYGGGELFGALRSLGVDVWIAPDRRLGVRMHGHLHFAQACELLAELDHDIQSLDLAYVPVRSLEPLIPLRSIERLDLTAAEADLEPLVHLRQLRALSLVGTDYASLSRIADLDQLEQLDLSGARANLTAVGQLTGLRELQLHTARTSPLGFAVNDGPGLDLAALGNLDDLEVLGLSHTKVRDWSALARLSTVVSLDLSYTNFSNLHLLEHFSDLEVLHLRRTAVANLEPLSRLASLQHVDLRDCQLYDPAQLAWLRQVRPHLRIDE